MCWLDANWLFGDTVCTDSAFGRVVSTFFLFFTLFSSVKSRPCCSRQSSRYFCHRLAFFFLTHSELRVDLYLWYKPFTHEFRTMFCNFRTPLLLLSFPVSMAISLSLSIAAVLQFRYYYYIRNVFYWIGCSFTTVASHFSITWVWVRTYVFSVG